MAIITMTVPPKGSSASVTLDKTELELICADVVDGTIFEDSATWNKVILYYISNQSNQNELVVFDATQTAPISSFSVDTNAVGSFLIWQIIIIDNQNGKLFITRSDLERLGVDLENEFDANYENTLPPSADYDLFFNGVASTGNGEIHNTDTANSWLHIAGLSTGYDGDFTWSGIYNPGDLVNVNISHTMVGIKINTPFQNGDNQDDFTCALYFSGANARGYAVASGIIENTAPLIANTNYNFEIKRVGTAVTFKVNNTLILSDTRSEVIYLGADLYGGTVSSPTMHIVSSSIVGATYLPTSGPVTWENLQQGSTAIGNDLTLAQLGNNNTNYYNSRMANSTQNFSSGDAYFSFKMVSTPLDGMMIGFSKESTYIAPGNFLCGIYVSSYGPIFLAPINANIGTLVIGATYTVAYYESINSFSVFKNGVPQACQQSTGGIVLGQTVFPEGTNLLGTPYNIMVSSGHSGTSQQTIASIDDVVFGVGLILSPPPPTHSLSGINWPAASYSNVSNVIDVDDINTMSAATQYTVNAITSEQFTNVEGDFYIIMKLIAVTLGETIFGLYELSLAVSSPSPTPTNVKGGFYSTPSELYRMGGTVTLSHSPSVNDIFVISFNRTAKNVKLYINGVLTNANATLNAGAGNPINGLDFSAETFKLVIQGQVGLKDVRYVKGYVYNDTILSGADYNYILNGASTGNRELHSDTANLQVTASSNGYLVGDFTATYTIFTGTSHSMFFGVSPDQLALSNVNFDQLIPFRVHSSATQNGTFYAWQGLYYVNDPGLTINTTYTFEIKRVNGIITYKINGTLRYTGGTAHRGQMYLYAGLGGGYSYSTDSRIVSIVIT